MYEAGSDTQIDPRQLYMDRKAVFLVDACSGVQSSVSILMFSSAIYSIFTGKPMDTLHLGGKKSVFELLALSCRYLLFHRSPVQGALGAFGC